MYKIKLFLGAFLIYFFSWVLVYSLGINKLAIQSEDTLPTMLLPVSIIKDHTFYVDNYYQMLLHKYPNPDDTDFTRGFVPFYVKQVGIHYISSFPLVAGLLSVPVYFLPVTLGVPITWENLTVLAHLSAALIAATSGVALYVLLKKHLLQDDKKALGLTLIYLFATINFALVSQSLWQHGVLELFTILGIYFMYGKKYFMFGLSMGLAILSRPTAIVPATILGILLFIKSFKDKKLLLNYCLKAGIGVLLCALFFFWYNNKYYVSVENQGYASQIVSEWKSNFPEGFLGVWLSPSKGILVYSPVFIFSLAGLWLARKKPNYLIFGLIVLLHTLVIGKWKHWYGGWSFGYRMSSDIIPFLILLLVPYLKSSFFEKTKKLFYALVFLSVGIEVFGLLFFDGIWHAAYDNGFEHTSWLWSIKDSEFVFNMRRVLVKVGLLAKACPKC